MKKHHKLIEYIFEKSIEVKKLFYQENSKKISDVINRIVTTFKTNKGKILIFGNGGSAADAQHIAGEFVNKFLCDRKALPAIALTTDTSVITSIGNDIGYDQIFSRQIEALGSSGDFAMGISTSGNSINVLNGLKTAKEMGLDTVAFLGCNGGLIHKEFPNDLNLIVPAYSTPRIQESHITLAHTICEIVELIILGQSDIE